MGQGWYGASNSILFCSPYRPSINVVSLQNRHDPFLKHRTKVPKVHFLDRKIYFIDAQLTGLCFPTTYYVYGYSLF